MRASILLFLAVLLGGCGAQPARDSSDCCNGPRPGTVSISVGGNVTTSVGAWGR